jgi:glycosyltransferase involved in cell wall biosynthesis
MGSPLRILHVVVNMNRGGAETLIMNLYRNMDRSKLQFDFLTCKEGVFDAEIMDLGGLVHRIPYVTDVGHFTYIEALTHFFRAHPEYRIVHSHMDKMSGFVLRSAKRAGVPYRIAHSHNTGSEGSMAAKLYKWYGGNYVSRCATHFLACSNAAARWLYERKDGKAIILKNGIESSQFQFSPEIREQVREELNLSSDCLVIGHVGRFNHQKNHFFLIDIFSDLIHSNPDSVLVLVGEGSLRSELEKKTEALNLKGNIKFLGLRGDINRLLQAFDVFVFPSFHEGLPVTLIEAQGAGLPCVISDTITPEVDMGVELIDYACLTDRMVWVEKIIKAAKRDLTRRIPVNALSQRGHEIKHTAEMTQDFYLAMSR